MRPTRLLKKSSVTSAQPVTPKPWRRRIRGPQRFFHFSETLRIFFLCKGRNTKKRPMNNRSLPVKTRILFLSALVGAAFVCLPIAQAATITVANTNDSGAGSLGPLQNNGGPTFTHALLPGSPAIDAGNPSFTPPPNYDQRDCPFLRVFGSRIDVGAFESQPQPQSRPCPSPKPRPTPGPR
jgi:hypothetical protein